VKSYRTFLIVFLGLLAIYVIAELNRPAEIDWTVTLQKGDTNPYGAYILYNRLKDVFPTSSIVSLREPAYNLLHDKEARQAAYFIIAPTFGGAETDVHELLRFAEDGNFVFLSAAKISKPLMDTLGLDRDNINSLFNDSTALNFVNPALRTDSNYRYKKFTVDDWFGKLNKRDSTTVLGTTQLNKPDFVRINVGKGAFFVHAAPLVFSNYFMLYNNNQEYAAKALSYIPADTKTIYWDEYYKMGRSGPSTPLRFFLSNEWLRWALRLTIFGFILYIFVEMKRRQRVIPVIEPLKNTTLDFVKTVSSVYLSQKDNRSIADNKIQYWLQHIRQRYYLQTNELNSEFVGLLSKKSTVPEAIIQNIIDAIAGIHMSHSVTDRNLL
jgi:hypothetical protein